MNTERGERGSSVTKWIPLVGIAAFLVGVGLVLNLLVAQSHSVDLADAVTPTALRWLVGGFLIALLGVALRGE